MAEKGSVTSKVSHYIREHIRSGDWKVGQKIPSENQLCSELGVSRVSVRNAIQQFIALGILESEHGKGTFLLSNDLSMFLPVPGSIPENTELLDRMKSILQFRSLIEPSICGLVAETASPELISQLEQYLDIMQGSVGKCEVFVQADVNFHLEICRASGNPVIIAVMNDIFRQRADLGNMLALATGYYGGVYYHNLILSAIRNHNSTQAKAMMQEHLERGLDDLMADNPDSPTSEA